MGIKKIPVNVTRLNKQDRSKEIASTKDFDVSIEEQKRYGEEQPETLEALDDEAKVVKITNPGEEE